MTAIGYSTDDTALLIVDRYNDFMSKDGKYYERTKETAEAVGFYDNVHKLIPAVREARIQVTIVPHHRWRESDYKISNKKDRMKYTDSLCRSIPG